MHEFCDLSLARCAWFEPVLRKTLQGYGDEVRLVWWDVGDPQRPEARRARRAALAADATPGGFWRMHDAILADLRTDDFRPPPPEKLGLPALREHALRLGIDLATFDYAMASDDETPAEREEVERARGLGLRPGTLVIDGEVHSGFEPLSSRAVPSTGAWRAGSDSAGGGGVTRASPPLRSPAASPAPPSRGRPPRTP